MKNFKKKYWLEKWCLEDKANAELKKINIPFFYNLR